MVVFYNMSEDEVKSYTNFHLSIELNKSEISLLLVDNENSKPEAIEHISGDSFSVKKLINSSEILAIATPKTVSCVVTNSQFTLVPKALYSPSNKADFLDQVVDLNSDVMVKEDQFLNNETVACFAMSKQQNEELLTLFPTVKIKHISSILCDSIADGISINFSTELSYEIAIKKEKKLLYFNRFSFENEEESLYYLSLITEEHKLNLTKEKLHLSGKIFSDSATLSFWKQFIPSENITFNDIETSQMNAVSRHQFFTLYKQHSCVL